MSPLRVLAAVLLFEHAPGALGWSAAAAGPARSFLPAAAVTASSSPRLPVLRLTATQQKGGVEAELASMEFDDQLKSTVVGLLGQMDKVVELCAKHQTVGIDEFRSVLSQVDVECTDADAARIFTLVDSSATGAVIPSKMKSALRNSGIVSEMYRDSLANFGKIFAATALFGVGIAYFESPAAAFNFITGYVVEDSLSVDNLFVFLIIFRTFKVPANLQLLCLNYGIAGAVVLRAVCIFTGLALVDAFEPVLLGFSAFLLYTSYTLLDLGKTEGGEDEEDEEDAPPEFITNFVDKLPTTGTFEGDKLVVAKEGGGFLATQLLLTLITIELSDLVFAVDSIPAVFAVTDDPFVVYTSNIAAILGLRSLYQILAIAVTDLEYLETGVAIVLGFIGLKLLAQFAGFPIDSLVSLSVVVGILGGSVGLSLYENRKEE